MTSFISSCCAICVAFGVIVGDGGRPVSTMGCTVAVVVDVGDRAKVIVGVEIDASVAVKISIGDGDGIKGCCNTGVQEDKITTRITIVAVCNFICPTFSSRKKTPNGWRYLRWGGVGDGREQEKLEAMKMLENAAESHTSGARFVGRFYGLPKTLVFNIS